MQTVIEISELVSGALLMADRDGGPTVRLVVRARSTRVNANPYERQDVTIVTFLDFWSDGRSSKRAVLLRDGEKLGGYRIAN